MNSASNSDSEHKKRPPRITEFYIFPPGASDPIIIPVKPPDYTVRRRNSAGKPLPPTPYIPPKYTNQQYSFRQLIQEIKNQASKLSAKMNKNSLLQNAQYYENAFNQGLFDLDYLNFYNEKVENKIPFYLIPQIVDIVKNYTGINITPYTRDERKNKNLNILKSCMIYHHVFEQFKYFAYTRNFPGKLVPKIPNETLDIPTVIQNYILDQWNHITENTQLVHQNIFNILCQLNDRIHGVIMFQFYNLIFIIPITRSGSMPNIISKIIDTNPIPIPGIPPYQPPQPPQPIQPQPPMIQPPPPPQYEDSIPPLYRISNLMNQPQDEWF